MNRNAFELWKPEGGYDVNGIAWNEGVISFRLVPDGMKKAERELSLMWNGADLLAYHVTDESYRPDCWRRDPERDGRIFMARDSEYLTRFRQDNPLVPEGALHFLIVGTNTVVDVLAKCEPEVCVINLPCKKE